MIALGIETSHEHGSVGLTHDGLPTGELLFLTEFERSENLARASLGPGERLLPAIESLLTLTGITRHQLELICVALGPGSFTSLRIGLAMGKGLAQALHIPIVGVPSMAAYPQRVSFVSGKICVVLPDRRDLVSYALYEGAAPITPEVSCSIDALRDKLSQMPDLALCIGPGAERHRALLEPITRVAPAALNRPSGALCAQVGASRYAQTQRDELWTVEPLYVQKLITTS